MTILKYGVIVAIILAAGLIICPCPPKGVNPHELLEHVLHAEQTQSCAATDRYTANYYGRTITCTTKYPPSVRPTQSNPQSAKEQAVYAELIRNNYNPMVEGEDKIAGRKVWTLFLKPKYRSEPWREMWVDEKTYAVLAWRDWGAQKTMNLSMKTLSISKCRVNNDPADCPAPTVAGAVVNLTSASKALGWKVPEPSYIPMGFKMIGVLVDKERNLAQLDYSDGLFTLSIFVTHSRQLPPYFPPLDKPRNWGQGLMASFRTSNGFAAVVADLFASDITTIGRSLR